MQTRYSSLVKLKKSEMDKSERVMQKASADLNSALSALQLSYSLLENIQAPSTGIVSDLLASRTLLNSQRDLIKHNQEWVAFAKQQVTSAKNALKKDMIEYEKFKYLEVEEIKKISKIIKIKESKELDEIALITFPNKGNS